MISLVLVLALAASGAQAQSAYDIWAANLITGYTIVPTVISGENCFCKVPANVTSTTTTTSTTSTTSTTTTSTTTTTTTTSTTTTTITSTTTTAASSTTTAAPSTTTGGTVFCDATITIGHLSEDYWETPNYPNQYPENIDCYLTIEMPSSMGAGLATITVDGSPAVIYETTGCAGDSLITNDGAFVCGNLAGQSFSEMSFSLPATFVYHFTTTSADGGTAEGFRIKVEGVDLFLGK